MPGRRALHLILCLTLVAGAAACGGDDDDGGGGGGETVEKQAWIADLCTAIGNWATEVADLAEGIGGAVGEGAEPEEARDALVELFDGAIAATEEMLDGVEAAGAPDIEDGDQMAADLLDKLQETKTILEDGRQEAEDLPVDDAAEFQSAATELGLTVQESFEALGEGFEELDETYDDVDLEQDFQDEPACAVLE